MEVQDLKQMISKKDIPSFLIFTGEEWKIQQIYLQQIAKVKNLDVKYIDRVADVWSALSSRSLFQEKHLYIVRDDKDLMTNEKAYSQIESMLTDNMLILTCTSVDKRLKMIKTYDKSIVDFKPLKNDILKRYIQKEIQLSDRNCEILMEICEYNYGRCLLEIDKMKQYLKGVS